MTCPQASQQTELTFQTKGCDFRSGALSVTPRLPLLFYSWSLNGHFNILLLAAQLWAGHPRDCKESWHSTLCAPHCSVAKQGSKKGHPGRFQEASAAVVRAEMRTPGQAVLCLRAQMAGGSPQMGHRSA